MKKAHNLPIEDIIRALQDMRSKGYKLVDATVHGYYDLSFRPSGEEPPPFFLDTGTDLLQLI